MNMSTRVLEAVGRFWIDLRYGRGHLVDTITGLSEKEKKLIQDSREILLANSSETGVNIMLKFFHKYPHYLKYYSFSEVHPEILKHNEAFLKEAKKLMDAVDKWVGTLGEPCNLRDILMESGKMYVERAFPEQYFWDFGRTFSEYLAPLMDRKTLEAWTKLIKFAMKTLVSSLK